MMKILMFPWLAHGHIAPFLELAKKLTAPGRNIEIRVYLCSTRVNLESIELQKHRLMSERIELVELSLASSSELPPHHHTTNGLPPHLMDNLKQAFHESAPSHFSEILETLTPDLLIYDFIQDWAPDLASSYNIPAVQLSLVSACCTSYFLLHLDDGGFPFPEIWMSDFEKSRIPLGVSTKERSIEAMRRSNKVLLVRTLREIEGKYLDHLGSKLGDKRMVATGPLVKDPDQEQTEDGSAYDYISAWLDQKSALSTVFVSFGSEYFLTREEAEEVAHGLELSPVNFIWVVRLPRRGMNNRTSVESLIPKGFVERVGKRGLVVEGWAPQARILAHPGIGGFVSHCGWNSVLESMKLGVPIIAMPMQTDQPINARLVASLGIGMEVKRDEHGVFRRDEIARVIAKVVVERQGQDLRTRVEALRDLMLKKGDKDVDEVVKELVQICKEYGKLA